MSHPYPGNPSFPVNITIPDDGDLDAAVAYSVALEQLADRTTALTGGGVGVDFTNATFHGTTTFADGTIAATVTSITINATSDCTIAAADGVTISGDFVDLLGGVGFFAAGGIELGTSVALGLGTSHLTEVRGTLSCLHDATFPAGKTVTLAGTNTLPAGSATTVGGTLSVNGPLRLKTTNVFPIATTVDGTTGYEHIFANATVGDVAVTVTHSGATLGQRVRLNAQNVTGLFDYQVFYGARQWFMRNATGKTVILELVSDGASWVVDDWAEGGLGIRNG